MSTQPVCPQCGETVDPAQRFCPACGAALQLECPACGAQNPPSFRFCGNCGVELDASQRAVKERRMITVLFADLAGFTARAERLDPEEVEAILSPYHARVREEIESYGGVVEKFIGDAIVAVFGAPIAHGDDPERAVRAALAARDAIADLNATEPELDLQVRLAVNTGEAIVSFGSAAPSGEGMVAGDVVNTASRLQAVAPVNGILVGAETYRATAALIEYQPVEPLTLKGKREPVPAWLAVRAALPAGERRGRDAPIVGRDHELAVLDRIWEGVVSERRPQLVTIFGPSGIGKTRLAKEFQDRVAAAGARVLRGRSVPYGGTTAYGPFAQQVRQVARIFDNDSATEAEDKLRGALGALLEEEAEAIASHIAMLIGVGVEGEVADRGTLFFSARRLVERLAEQLPTMLVFEDLHWAAPSMLDLLELFATRIRELPLLLLSLARPDLLTARPGWGGGLPAYTALPLEPLNREQAEELAGRLLAGAEAAQTERIVETAEGNPLFIEELAASLIEQSTADGGTGLPVTVHGIVSARLDALPPTERALLLDASVVGKIFWRGGLERMGWTRADAVEALDALEGRDLIRREAVSRIQGDEQFAFKHMLIRDVAYATLSRAKRSERHTEVALYLEEVTAETGAVTATIAGHWREAGDARRAIRYLLLAAEQAERGWAKEEAVGLYKEALELVPDDEPELRRQITLRQAVAFQAFLHVVDARRLARRSGGDA